MLNHVSFSEPMDLPEGLAPFLPYNYLPAAFAAITGEPSAGCRLLISLPHAEEDQAGAQYTFIDAETLSDPAATARFVKSLEGVANPQGEVTFFLGPDVGTDHLTGQPPAVSTQLRAIAPSAVAAEDMAGFDRAVVIIDSGIAFWNRRFRGPAGPRFRDIRFLDFARPDLGLGAANLLNPGRIADLCAVADTEGSARVMELLGAEFPNSFYGKAGSPDADGIWHGTAVADLAAGADPGDGGVTDRLALFGIELPESLLRDSDGDALTAVLSVLVDQVIAITRGVGHVDLVVALPFGFVGGPQDGMHPAARAIEVALSRYASRSGSISFLVPAGNHLQDRCRARLPQAQGGVPPLSVDWYVAPDDFSTNQIEILINHVDPADGRASLQIAPPGTAAAQVIGLKAGQYHDIVVDGAIVGRLMRHANTAMPPPPGPLRARLRLCLAPTGYRPGGGIPAHHGIWRLSTLSVQPVDLWVLRDDRDRVLDEAFPRRSSWLDDPLYQDEGQTGAPELVDQAASLVLRSGTLSVLATAPSVQPVQADERLGAGPRTKAFYSGSPDTSAGALRLVLEAGSQLVDDGYPLQGVMAAANGTERRVRFSGTSAAVGLAARAKALAP